MINIALLGSPVEFLYLIYLQNAFLDLMSFHQRLFSHISSSKMLLMNTYSVTSTVICVVGHTNE